MHMVGEPVSACRGNRLAGCGGTAGPDYLNAYLIQKVRTPSGKPGCVKKRETVKLAFFYKIDAFFVPF